MRGTANIVVHKPIEQVWEYISDISKIGQWMDGVSEPEVTSDGAIAQGSTFTSKYRFDNKTHHVSYVLTAYDPPNHFNYRINGGPHASLNVVDLKSDGSATKIKHMMELDVSDRTIGAVFLGMGPFVRLSIMFKVRKDLKRLKALIEAS